MVFVKAKGGYLTTPRYGMETGVYVVNADAKSEPRLVTEEGSAPQFANENGSIYVSRTQYTSEVDWTTSLVKIDLNERNENAVAKSEFATEFALSQTVNGWHLSSVTTPMSCLYLKAGKAVTISPKMDALPVKQLDVNAGQYLHWSGEVRNFTSAWAMNCSRVN